MTAVLTVYVLLVIPTLLGTLEVARRALDLLDRIEARWRDRRP